MKSYLDLVSLSGKIHRRQNRMSVFCILLAAALVTTIFGMADAFIRSQILQTKKEEGDWHIMIRDITDGQSDRIAVWPGVSQASRYATLNYRYEQGYKLCGKDVVILGNDIGWIGMLYDSVADGAFPRDETQAMLSESVRDTAGVQIGDPVSLTLPDGAQKTYTVSGFFHNVSKTLKDDSYGLFLTTEAFRALYPNVSSDRLADYDTGLMLQFSDTRHIRRAIAELKEAFGLSEDQIIENTKMLGLLGQSGDQFMTMIYGSAAILFVLVLATGILMIAGSLNSSVARRTEFFGLLRCVGATPRQVMRMVYKEALLWCRVAIPAGIGLGIVVIWLLCFILRKLSPQYLGAVPVFLISVPSILTGSAVGLLTVLLAARSPARKAAKVSPLVAASGNAADLHPVYRASRHRFFRIDTALGIHHAVHSPKNLLLMAGSFGSCVLLFLAFSATISFMRRAINPLEPWTPDLSIISPGNERAIDDAYVESLRQNEAVRRAYARMFSYDVPAENSRTRTKIDLVSYDRTQLEWAEKYLLSGTLEEVADGSDTGLVVYEPGIDIQTGDTVTLDFSGRRAQIRIVGCLSESPFRNAEDTGILICSEETFRRMTEPEGAAANASENRYTVVDLQLKWGAAEKAADAIRNTVPEGFSFSDRRMQNDSVRGVYYCFCLFIYGFLTVIALISVFNVINGVSMSVSARTKLYGAFRAIGMSNRQLARMVVAETVVYTASGSLLGACLGLFFHKKLFESLVSFRWGDAWTIPWDMMALILSLVALSVLLAVRKPVRDLSAMSIVDTINAQ